MIHLEDWSTIFLGAEREGALATGRDECLGQIILWVDSVHQTVIQASENGHSRRDWRGKALNEFQSWIDAGRCDVLQWNPLEGVLAGLGTEASVLEQVEAMNGARLELTSRSEGPSFAMSHFLISFIRSSPMRKLFPELGYVCLFLDEAFLLEVHHHDIRSIQRADSVLYHLNLDEYRSLLDTQVVECLKDRLGKPVVGLRVSSSEWKAWSESTSPWRACARALRSGDAELVPFQWGVYLLAGARSLIGL